MVLFFKKEQAGIGSFVKEEAKRFATFSLRLPWLALAGAAPAAGQAVMVRTADHGLFGRVVFDVAAGQPDSEDRQGDRLTVRLPGAGAVAGAPAGTLRVVSVAGGSDVAVLNLAPNTATRIWRQIGMLVVDTYKAAPSEAEAPLAPPAVAPQAPPRKAELLTTQRDLWAQGAAPAAEMPPREAKPIVTLASGRTPPVDTAPLQVTLVPMGPPTELAEAPKKPPATPRDTAPAAIAPASQPAQAAPITSAPAPGSPSQAGDALAAVRLPSDPNSHEESILVPFDPQVGAAAFALAGRGHVVFDDAKPVDLAALKDDRIFGGAGVKLLASGTHFSLPLAPGMRLRLHRRPEGWVVAVTAAGGLEDAADIIAKDGVINIGEHGAADTVVMDDPSTGGRLLVGTVLTQGPPVAVKHVSAEFTLLPSWTGVVVAPQSDRIVLRADKVGFQLRTASGPALAAVLGGRAEAALAEAGTLTRHFDFSSLPPETMMKRLGQELGTAAAAPRLARLQPRLRAAQDMLGLGLDREAAALLRVAIEDDPRAATDADAQALLAMAQWLGGASDAEGGSAALGLSGSDEATLWGAVMHPTVPSPVAAAATLAADWRLLLAYPAPLRKRLVPAVVDAMLAGGEIQAAASLLARVTDPALDDARAAVLQRQGKQTEALALLDQLAAGPDRKRAASATLQAVELRLAGGQLTAADAAAALARHLYAWRDDNVELALRLRVAALQSQAAAPRPALALLRETETLFPDAHDEVRAAEHQVLMSMLRSGAGRGLSPLDMVAFVAENQDLLTDKDASTTLTPGPGGQAVGA